MCAESAHLNVDEGGAPERIGGIKLLTVATPDGKLTPELVQAWIVRIGDEHAVQPGVVSVTQSTELGTLYTPRELRALADHAHDHGMRLHVDGARLANAAAALGRAAAGDHDRRGRRRRLLRRHQGGPDARRGGRPARRRARATRCPYLRKQSMQLASKMRYIAAQFEALLTDELWRRAAGHANAMAARLAAAVEGIDGVRITQAVQANVVFAVLPPGVAERLQQDWGFYTWDEHTGEVRWMCAHDTRAEDVDAFAAAVAAARGMSRYSAWTGSRARSRWYRSTGSRSAARACASRTGTTTTSSSGSGTARAPTGSTAASSRSRRAR